MAINKNEDMLLRDYGQEPLVISLKRQTELNTNYRAALWTGKYMQLTLMSIKVGENIGLEMHSSLDQFISIESGNALVKMGKKREALNFQKTVSANYAVIIPAGTWHNVINIGNTPLKLYSIYAPPAHPQGTTQANKTAGDISRNIMYRL